MYTEQEQVPRRGLSENQVAVRSFLTALFAVASVAASSLNGQQKANIYGGAVHHDRGVATVLANGARPLFQAITAVREEYGWVVDYEEPAYQSVVDFSSIPWPAHPGARWLVIGGGNFQSTYPESSISWSSPESTGQTLAKVVTDYNTTQNPGMFMVRLESDGRHSVVGVSVHNNTGNQVPTTPILDTPISLAGGTRDALTIVNQIAEAISRLSGIRVNVGTVPLNALAQSRVQMGGTTLPARTFVIQVLDGTPWKMGWDLLYDPQFREFALNISLARRAQYDADGNRRLLPVRIPRPGNASN